METQGNKKNMVLSHWAYIWEKSVSEGYLNASLPLFSNIQTAALPQWSRYQAPASLFTPCAGKLIQPYCLLLKTPIPGYSSELLLKWESNLN